MKTHPVKSGPSPNVRGARPGRIIIIIPMKYYEDLCYFLLFLLETLGYCDTCSVSLHVECVKEIIFADELQHTLFMYVI
jgi:hypothetical protein